MDIHDLQLVYIGLTDIPGPQCDIGIISFHYHGVTAGHMPVGGNISQD